MTPMRWGIFAVIVAILFGGLLVMTRSDKIDVSSVDPKTIVTEGEFKDQIYGNEKATITLIEYGDFQCPSCGAAHPGLKQVKEEFKSDVRFVFRHFPLTSIHPNALVASAAAQAAADQGKFWQMHDVLFEKQNEWSNLSVDKRTEAFQQYAQSLQLDVNKFNAAMESDNISRYISYQREVGSKAGVNATPTFFLNGEKLDSSSEIYKNLLQGDASKLRAKLKELSKK